MWKGTILTSTFFTTNRCSAPISSVELQQLHMNSQEVHPVPIYLTPKQLKWRLKAADVPHWYNLAPFSQPHQGVPSWHSRILWPACPWKRHITYWERREKEKQWQIHETSFWNLSHPYSSASFYLENTLLWQPCIQSHVPCEPTGMRWRQEGWAKGCLLCDLCWLLRQSSFQLPCTHGLHLCSGQPAGEWQDSTKPTAGNAFGFWGCVWS